MQTDNKQIKLAIVDDHNLFRKGVIKLINLGDKHQRYTILFEADNGIDLKSKLDTKDLPDIILMDIDMPACDGYETVSWLKKYHPDISILVISMFTKEEAVIRMMQMGVNGYLSKDIEVEDMHMALEAIANKGLYFSDFVSDAIKTITNRAGVSGQVKDGKGAGLNELSENEREFLKLACTEATYVQIADMMHLSPKTIDGYRENLFSRFNVKSRVSLAMYAVKNGLVNLEN